MFLNETPHIRLRRTRSGLIYVDYTQLDILGIDDDSSTGAARSYNTIIGVYTRSSTGHKIYLETAGSYSTTTAAKHKPRAAALAEYNNYKIIPNIKPEILHDIYYHSKYSIDEILKEYQERQTIAAAIETRNPEHPEIIHAKTTGQIKAAGTPKPTNYKNGNRLVKYYYKTNFKFFSNIYFQVNQKAIKYNIKKAAGTFQTFQYNNKIVNISW